MSCCCCLKCLVLITPALLYGYRVAAFETKFLLNSVDFVKFPVFF